MSNENPKPNYDGDRSVLLKGGQPAIKEIEPKKPVVRQPQLSNADDLKAIQRNREFSAQVEPIVQSLRQMLRHNLPYVGHARKFLNILAEEIAENESDDAA